MTFRQKIFTIITGFVVMILIISVALISSKRGAQPNTNTQQNVITNTPTPPPEQVIIQNDARGVPTQIKLTPPPVGDAAAIEKAGVQRLAQVFIERYQSYSSENNFENIRQVQTLVTQSLWNKIGAALGRSQNGSFVGVTTSGFNSELVSYSSTAATVLVVTQREIDKNGTRTTEQQNYLVQLVKTAKGWFVDSFKTAT